MHSIYNECQVSQPVEVKQSQVSEQQDLLNGAIDRIFNLTDQLSVALKVVTRDEPETPTCSPTEQSLVPLANCIRYARFRLESHEAALTSILNRLEL